MAPDLGVHLLAKDGLLNRVSLVTETYHTSPWVRFAQLSLLSALWGSDTKGSSSSTPLFLKEARTTETSISVPLSHIREGG